VKIVHEVAALWDGTAVKNYGDKYLLIWKLPSYEQAVDKLEDDEKDKRLKQERQRAIEQGLDPDQINLENQ